MPPFQTQSLHLYLEQLAGGTSVQPFKGIEDYNNWLNRLEDYLTFLDMSIEKMKVGVEKGVVLLKVLTLKMLPQVRSFIGIPLEENLFYQPIMNFPDGLSGVDTDILKSNYENFNIKEFHSQILDSGSLSLVLLQEKIDSWIAGNDK